MPSTVAPHSEAGPVPTARGTGAAATAHLFTKSSLSEARDLPPIPIPRRAGLPLHRLPRSSLRLPRPRSGTQVRRAAIAQTQATTNHPRNPTPHVGCASCGRPLGLGVGRRWPALHLSRPAFTQPLVGASLGVRLRSRATKILPLPRERIEVRARRPITRIVVLIEGLTISLCAHPNPLPPGGRGDF